MSVMLRNQKFPYEDLLSCFLANTVQGLSLVIFHARI